MRARRLTPISSSSSWASVRRLACSRSDAAIKTRGAAVGASHVLEHLRSPIAALEAMASTLTVDGVIWAEVPNVRRPYGDLHTHYWQRAHLYSFSPETAALTALRAGLTGIASCAEQDHGRVLFLTARNPQARTPRTYAESVQLLGGEPQTGVEVATSLEAYQRARQANAGRRLGEFIASTGEADRWLREEVQRMADALGSRRISTSTGRATRRPTTNGAARTSAESARWPSASTSSSRTSRTNS